MSSVEPTIALAPEEDLAWIAEAERDHVITPWGVQSTALPKVVTEAKGCWFTDSTGKRYLDFMSQLVNANLGHQHPRVVEAIVEQARELCYIAPNFANRARSELALELDAIAPGDLTASFFTTGGAAANENAIRLARHLTGRSKVVARYRSYHGATGGAISLTGDPRRWGGEPGMPGIVRMFDPDPYRRSADDPVNLGGPHLEEILQYEGPQNVAAVILETVTGTNGPIAPPAGYLRSIREVCDRHGILMIADEVMVGFGRIGEWFAVDHWDVVPDIITFAKGLNSGYVPLGGMMVTSRIMDWLRQHPFPGGLTYAGHPLGCASAVAAIRAMREEHVLENTRAMGARLRTGLDAMVERHPSAGYVMGEGLLLGLELVTDKESKRPLVPFNAKGADAAPAQSVVTAAVGKGVWLGRHDNVIRLHPPLIVSAEEVDLALSVLDEALDESDRAAAELV